MEAFDDIDRTVLLTFGKKIVIAKSDGVDVISLGIFSFEIETIGSFDSVMKKVSVITLASSVLLSRGDRIEADGQLWVVDRKLKDDGQLATWNLHNG